MAELNLQLTRRQQEILLRGLRFVKSSVALDMSEWTSEIDQQRKKSYSEIAAVESMLQGATIVETAKV